MVASAPPQAEPPCRSPEHVFDGVYHGKVRWHPSDVDGCLEVSACAGTHASRRSGVVLFGRPHSREHRPRAVDKPVISLPPIEVSQHDAGACSLRSAGMRRAEKSAEPRKVWPLHIAIYAPYLKGIEGTPTRAMLEGCAWLLRAGLQAQRRASAEGFPPQQRGASRGPDTSTIAARPVNQWIRKPASAQMRLAHL